MPVLWCVLCVFVLVLCCSVLRDVMLSLFSLCVLRCAFYCFGLHCVVLCGVVLSCVASCAVVVVLSCIVMCCVDFVMVLRVV